MQTRVFFFGTPEIAVPALRALAADESIEIVGVGTPPAKPVGRKRIVTPCAVRVAADELGLPVHDVADRSGVEKIYTEQQFEFAVVIAFGVIFPANVLEQPPTTLNVHFSLLPRWRGASPVQAAILAGEEITGITIQKMVAELDAGPIVWQGNFDIGGRSTAELWHDLSEFTATILPDVVKKYSLSESIPQDDAAATYCGKFTRTDGEISPDEDARDEIWKKYRAFDPWPGIWMQTKKYGTLKILECSLEKTPGSVPLQSTGGEIFLEKIQLAGKSPASAADVLRGIPDLLDR